MGAGKTEESNPKDLDDESSKIDLDRTRYHLEHVQLNRDWEKNNKLMERGSNLQKEKRNKLDPDWNTAMDSGREEI
jgi:hypothetical protein